MIIHKPRKFHLVCLLCDETRIVYQNATEVMYWTDDVPLCILNMFLQGYLNHCCSTWNTRSKYKQKNPPMPSLLKIRCMNIFTHLPPNSLQGEKPKRNSRAGMFKTIYFSIFFINNLLMLIKFSLKIIWARSKKKIVSFFYHNATKD